MLQLFDEIRYAGLGQYRKLNKFHYDFSCLSKLDREQVQEKMKVIVWKKTT